METKTEPSMLAQKIRRLRESMEMSRPEFAEMLSVPPSTLKNYELGYREVGGAFLVSMASHPQLHQFTLWLLSDKTAPEMGQISPELYGK